MSIQKLFFLLLLLASFSCSEKENSEADFQELTAEEAQEFKQHFKNKTFTKSTSENDFPRESVHLYFSVEALTGLRLWAQYAEEPEHASHEWEIMGGEYNILKDLNSEVYKLQFRNLSNRIILPEECNDCLGIKSMEIFMKNPFDEDKIQFRIAEDKDLPKPYPLFINWTSLEEREIIIE